MAYPASDPRQLKARVDRGLDAHRRGNIATAVAIYREVLTEAPDFGPALNLLGTGLLQLGKADEAILYLERAIREQRTDANLQGNLAQAYLALEKYERAADAFRKASRLAPQAVQFQVGVAATLALRGELVKAEKLLKKLSVRFARAPLVWLNLGNVLRDLQRFDEALAAYRTALNLDPGMVDARNSIGSVLHSLLKFGDAEREYRACVESAPDYLIARYNLASVTMDLGRFGEAEAICREIVDRTPDLPDAHRLLGTTIASQARLLGALPWYKRAAELSPKDSQNAQAYGGALMEAGYSMEGLRWLAHAAALDPQSLSVKRVAAGVLLAHGFFREGWINYAARPAAGEIRARNPDLRLMESVGTSLKDSKVCVVAEQGLGDQLFFLRYAPQLALLGARIAHRASRKLHSLLERVPALEVVLRENAELPPADTYVLAGDLPRALVELPCSPIAAAGARSGPSEALPELRHRITIFWPPLAPTLRIAPLPEKMAAIREQLAAFGPPPYIAVTWRGGTAPEKQQTSTWLLFKSIGLREIGEALGRCKGTIVAVQRKPEPHEIEALANAVAKPVLDLSALNDDLESMLAALSLMDEYVGVSNTNMHLRAAAGRTARVLVPVPAEWRWMQHGKTSPWFPGFAVYRQSLQGDWRAALEHLRRDMEMNYGAPAASNTILNARAADAPPETLV